MDYFVGVQITSVVLIAVALAWGLIIKPLLQKKNVLTLEQLTFIDKVCQKGVDYAEQLYKSEKITADERNQLAIDYVFSIVVEAQIVPEMYIPLIKGMIESWVLKLPKTHDELDI